MDLFEVFSDLYKNNQLLIGAIGGAILTVLINFIKHRFSSSWERKKALIELKKEVYFTWLEVVASLHKRSLQLTFSSNDEENLKSFKNFIDFCFESILERNYRLPVVANVSLQEKVMNFNGVFAEKFNILLEKKTQFDSTHGEYFYQNDLIVDYHNKAGKLYVRLAEDILTDGERVRAQENADFYSKQANEISKSEEFAKLALKKIKHQNELLIEIMCLLLELSPLHRDIVLEMRKDLGDPFSASELKRYDAMVIKAKSSLIASVEGLKARNSTLDKELEPS